MHTSAMGECVVMLPIGARTCEVGFLCFLQGHFLVTYPSISAYMYGQYNRSVAKLSNLSVPTCPILSWRCSRASFLYLLGRTSCFRSIIFQLRSPPSQCSLLHSYMSFLLVPVKFPLISFVGLTTSTFHCLTCENYECLCQFKMCITQCKSF